MKNGELIRNLNTTEGANVFLSYVLGKTGDDRLVLDGLLVLLDFIGVRAEREEEDLWLFIEPLQLHLYAQSDEATEKLLDYKYALLASEDAPLDLPAMNPESLGTSDAAKYLSSILRSNETSDALTGAVLSMIAEMENNLPEQAASRLERLQYSPEYLERLFSSFDQLEGGE